MQAFIFSLSQPNFANSPWQKQQDFLSQVNLLPEEMGNGKWEMGNGKWEMGKHCTSCCSPGLATFTAVLSRTTYFEIKPALDRKYNSSGIQCQVFFTIVKKFF
jgi:hypothetical protein